MECNECRESLSARMDGEVEPFDAALVDKHVAECPACRSWQAVAQTVTRSLRVQTAMPVPDLSAAIMANAPVKTPRWIMPSLPWLRIGLAWIGFAQFVFGVFQLIAHLRTSSAPVDALHVFSEGSAWNVAMGCGLMYAAWKTKATLGLLPLLTPFAGIVAVVTVYDMVLGVIAPIHVVSHSMLVVGLVLLFAVHRQAGNSGNPDPRGARKASDGFSDYADDEVDGPTSGTERTPGRHLRPASRAA